MCNIAGYIGKKSAASILCKMMKRQEDFHGGYYSGICTHDGKHLHSAKVVGDMNNLLLETDALNLPGTTGFLHSRSNAGGGKEWAHPFLSGGKKIAYIANGTDGIFDTEENNAKKCALAKKLEREGAVFTSKTIGARGDYPLLSDGTAIHVSDLRCQHIAGLTEKKMTVDEAMSFDLSYIPSEVVGLVMHEKCVGKIFVSRVNYPMMIAVSTDGDTYLATTAMAFPEDVEFRFIEALPPAATVEAYEGGYRVSPHPVKINNVAAVMPDIWYNAYRRIEKMLSGKKSNPVTTTEMAQACADLFPQGAVAQNVPLVYEILRAMKKKGNVSFALVPDAGAFGRYVTNNFKMYI